MMLVFYDVMIGFDCGIGGVWVMICDLNGCVIVIVISFYDMFYFRFGWVM